MGSNKRIFWGCFIALIATAFGFQVRAQLMGTWASELGLSGTQQGEIFGAGLWPFAISIILFSLVIDKIGYGKAMVFGLVCHVIQALVLWKADSYEMLYWGSIIGGLGNGTVEAYINPVVATIFPKEKTKWLAILHAGWPGGLVIAGLLFMGVAVNDEAGNIVNYGTIILLTLAPVVGYGLILFGQKFPVNERVKAGVSFKEMLQEPGILSWAVVAILISIELSRALHLGDGAMYALMAILIIPYAVYVQKLGRPMFFLLVLVMAPLASTELGTDSWITPLMTAEFGAAGWNAGWVLIYTSLIMMILRFFAGPIVHRLAPLNLLAVSSVFAIAGLYLLGSVAGLSMIFLVATVYGIGKTFFWPATLGVVAEQFPRGGALTLNMVSGFGMMSVGILGGPWLGFVQDNDISASIKAADPAVHERVVAPKAEKFLGLVEYESVDAAKVTDADTEVVTQAQNAAKKNVLKTATVLPVSMLIVYIFLIMYFKGRGGYKPVELDGGDDDADGGDDAG
ncbi:MAG: MFS transporter, partial [Planctomycetota bacterium]|nr:MFS transporter [Planctomycetota bacterium]